MAEEDETLADRIPWTAPALVEALVQDGGCTAYCKACLLRHLTQEKVLENLAA